MKFPKAGWARFDDPTGGRYGREYASLTFEGAFAETFLWSTDPEQRYLLPQLLKRHLLHLTASRPLKLVDLTGRGLGRIGADGRLTTTAGYRLAQRWALKLWELDARADGLLYRARTNPSLRSVLLFDRARDVLSWEDLGLVTDQPGFWGFVDDYGLIDLS